MKVKAMRVGGKMVGSITSQRPKEVRNHATKKKYIKTRLSEDQPVTSAKQGKRTRGF